MTKVGQAQTYCLFEPKPVVWGLANEVCHHFEKAYIACLELSRGHKRELQGLVRKLDVLHIVVHQEGLKRFPGERSEIKIGLRWAERAFRCSGLIHPGKPAQRVCGPESPLGSEILYIQVIRP